MSLSAYDLPSDPAKRRSRLLTDGPDRAPARSYFKAIGFTDDDLAKPLVGIASTWIETMPCNYNQRELAEYVRRGIRAAGGMPVEFNTIAVSDGVTMGTPGMRGSLVSREVIADSIELAAYSHMMDGLVCLVGCDKTIPAAVMALLRLDIPGLVLYNGSIAPGHWRGRDVTIQDVFEAVGTHAVGKLTDDDLHELETLACPGAGACGGQFTANTMSMALDFLGISPAGLNEVPATDRGKNAAAHAAGELVMKLVRENITPRQIVTREALENAITSVAASGGSTNGVLHLLAIAREADVPLDIDDFEEIAARTPVIASLTPGGHYVATDLYDAGGCALVARELAKRDLLHLSAPNVDGRTLAEIAFDAKESEGQQVVSKIEQPFQKRGGFAILRGNLAPEGCVVKLAGHERTFHRGPARIFDSESRQGGRRRRGRDPLRRAGGWPRNARDACGHRRHRRRGAGRLGRADHRRALLWRHAWIHGRPRLSRSRTPWPDRRLARGRRDRSRCRGARAESRAFRRRDRVAAGRLEGAGTALHKRRLRQVRGARELGLRGSDYSPESLRCAGAKISSSFGGHEPKRK